MTYRLKSPHQRRVEEFMVRAGQYVRHAPEEPTGEERIRIVTLILEELRETARDMGVCVKVQGQFGTVNLTCEKTTVEFKDNGPSSVNIAGAVDGLGDLSVVVTCGLSAFGVADESLLTLIDSANLSKFEPPKCPDCEGVMELRPYCRSVNPDATMTVDVWFCSSQGVNHRTRPKEEGPYRRVDGKHIKPPYFVAPDIGEHLHDQTLEAQAYCVDNSLGSPKTIHTFEYTDRRGENRQVRTLAEGVWTFGTDQWHPFEGWRYTAYDVDRLAFRTYVIQNITKWGTLPLPSFYKKIDMDAWKEWMAGQRKEIAEKVKLDLDKLVRFKEYVHKRLDEVGVPIDPDSPHKANGCRIGGRLDWLLNRMPKLKSDTFAEALYRGTNKSFVQIQLDCIEYHVRKDPESWKRVEALYGDLRKLLDLQPYDAVATGGSTEANRRWMGLDFANVESVQGTVLAVGGPLSAADLEAAKRAISPGQFKAEYLGTFGPDTKTLADCQKRHSAPNEAFPNTSYTAANLQWFEELCFRFWKLGSEARTEILSLLVGGALNPLPQTQEMEVLKRIRSESKLHELQRLIDIATPQPTLADPQAKLPLPKGT